MRNSAFVELLNRFYDAKILFNFSAHIFMEVISFTTLRNSFHITGCVKSDDLLQLRVSSVKCLILPMMHSTAGYLSPKLVTRSLIV